MSAEWYFIVRPVAFVVLLIAALYLRALTLKNCAALVVASAVAGAFALGLLYFRPEAVLGIPVEMIVGSQYFVLYCDILFLALAAPLFALMRRMWHVRGLGWDYWILLAWGASAYVLVAVLVAIIMKGIVGGGCDH